MELTSSTGEKDRLYRLYSIPSYSGWTIDRIRTDYEEYSINGAKKKIKSDKHYHERIERTKSYKIFGDIDGYDKPFEDFEKLFVDFLQQGYGLEIVQSDICYTSGKEGSYHYSVPKYYGSCKKLKEIHVNFIRIYSDQFQSNKVIDTTIYSDHWFRLPNQSKGRIKGKCC